MNELMNMTASRMEIDCRLLVTVSAAALLGFAIASDARAADSEKPEIVIDLSGQFDQLSDKRSEWAPDYMGGPNAGPLSVMFSGAQKPPRTGYDASAGISIRPDGGDWVFSASVHFGKASRTKEVSKSAAILPSVWSYSHHSHFGAATQSDESHFFLNFEAGKDVGIGSTIAVGIRVADMRSGMDVHISSNFPPTFQGNVTNIAGSRISHDFRGAGPSISWKSSLPLSGNAEDGQLKFDWGVNAALLFGRQTTKQSADASYYERVFRSNHYFHYSQSAHTANVRRRTVVVPGLGGFAGLSMQWSNAKLSLGYRGDFYFGAIDGGIDTPRREARGFYGPFAGISIGISPSNF